MGSNPTTWNIITIINIFSKGLYSLNGFSNKNFNYVQHSLFTRECEQISNNTNIKRKGPAEVISKSGDCLWVRIRLSAIPNLDWQQCFKELPAFQLNEAYSKGLRFNGDNSFDIQSTMRGLESNIKWIDKFIEQANASCKNKLAEKIAEKKSQEELEALRKEEIRKINESIKRI